MTELWTKLPRSYGRPDPKGASTHQGTETPAGLRIGELVADKYRIKEVLGFGGMGVVVAAQHLALDEPVAIKFLLPEALKSREAVARFVREARAAVKIKNEHVARIIDVGILPSGAPFTVMEFLEGCDLADLIDAQGSLAVPLAVEYVLQACEALAEAHRLGIIHRDLKPANLFRIERSDGSHSIKLLDFGISKVSGTLAAASEANLTQTKAVLGTPLCMSPEQLLSPRDVDHRTDIWSLGTVLYELVTGYPPFRGETLPEICARVASQPPTPLRELRPDVSHELQAVILRCLEKDRTRRFSSVAELAFALGPFAPSRAHGSIERIHRTLGVPVPMLAAAAGGREVPSALLDIEPRRATTAGPMVSEKQTSFRRQPRSSLAAPVSAGFGALLALGAAVWAIAGARGGSEGEDAGSTIAVGAESAPTSLVPLAGRRPVPLQAAVAAATRGGAPTGLAGPAVGGALTGKSGPAVGGAMTGLAGPAVGGALTGKSGPAVGGAQATSGRNTPLSEPSAPSTSAAPKTAVPLVAAAPRIAPPAHSSGGVPPGAPSSKRRDLPRAQSQKAASGVPTAKAAPGATPGPTAPTAASRKTPASGTVPKRGAARRAPPLASGASGRSGTVPGSSPMPKNDFLDQQY